MLGWFQALMPKEEKFFDLFERHAAITLAAAQSLRALLDGGDKVASQCEAVFQLEEDADVVAREVAQALRKTFITPFDRGDIQSLIDDMDDAIDQMRQTVKAIRLFDVVAFEPGMVKIGDLVVELARVAVETLPLLRSLNANAARIHAANEKTAQLEEESRPALSSGLESLVFATQGRSSDGLYRRSGDLGDLEKIVDCFEDVASRIDGILPEHM